MAARVTLLTLPRVCLTIGPSGLKEAPYSWTSPQSLTVTHPFYSGVWIENLLTE